MRMVAGHQVTMGQGVAQLQIQVAEGKDLVVLILVELLMLVLAAPAS